MELEPIKQPHWRDPANPLTADMKQTIEAVSELVDRVNILTEKLEILNRVFNTHVHSDDDD